MSVQSCLSQKSTKWFLILINTRNVKIHMWTVKSWFCEPCHTGSHIYQTIWWSNISKEDIWCFNIGDCSTLNQIDLRNCFQEVWLVMTEMTKWWNHKFKFTSVYFILWCQRQKTTSSAVVRVLSRNSQTVSTKTPTKEKTIYYVHGGGQNFNGVRIMLK